MFVLSNKYSNLPLDEKRRIIHETKGAESKKAVSVELILNNKPRKLPVENDTVTIKRVFDSETKRDEYYINGKHIHIADLKHILEVAGLSFANPFYFVQQGRISSIIALNEVQLFIFISEVAGTKVFDEKKVDTLKSLEETKEKRQRLSVLLGKIDVHIERLSKDAKLLKQYKKIEGEKLTLEYQVLELRMKRVGEKIIQMNDEREKRLQNFEHSKNQEQALKIQHEGLQKEKLIKERQLQVIKDQIERLRMEKQEVESTMNKHESVQEITYMKEQEIRTELAALEVELAGIEDGRQKELENIERLEESVKELDNRMASFNGVFQQKCRRYEELTTKEGIGKKFESPEDKMKFVKEEQKKHQKALENWKSEKATADKEIVRLLQKQNDIENKLEESKEKYERIKEQELTQKLQTEELQNKRLVNVNRIKAIEIEMNDLESQKRQYNDQAKMYEEDLSKAMGSNNLYHTIKMLKAEISRSQLQGVYGLLIDLINVEKSFIPCADIIGRNALFGFVVDTVETAERILELNRRIHGSVITIYPLEIVEDMMVKDYKYPEESDCMPLINHISVLDNIDSRIWRICKRTFAKALLVKDYKTAIRLAKERGFHCVTIECEIVYSGGFISRVGLYDLRRERISLYNNVTEAKTEVLHIDNRLKELSKERDMLKEDNAEVMSQLRSSDLVTKNLREELRKEEMLMQRCENEMHNLKLAEASAVRMTDHCEAQIKLLRAKKEDFTALLSDVKGLTKVETEEMKVLVKEIMGDEKQLRSLMIEKAKRTDDITKMQQRVEQFFNVRKGQIKERIRNLSHPAHIVEVKGIEGADELASRLAKVTLELENKQADFKIESEKQVELHNLLYKLEKKLNKYKKNVEDDLECLEKLNSEFMELEEEKLNFEQQMERIKKPIKKTLEAAAKEQKDRRKESYEEENELIGRIAEKVSSLGQYKNIYKDAYDIYVKYTEKRKNFDNRIEEFNRTEEAIHKLINSLDQDKSKSFINTFKIIENNFEKMFREIIPTGTAKLRLLKCDEEIKETSSQGIFNIGDKKYKGIAIQVTFDESGAYQNLHQLSGGQKVAVAISLIFAIQHLDPPPVYILDEIDSALDANYRMNLANLIEKQAKHSQFIATTFKPELLEVGNKFYGVEFKHKKSVVKEITSEQAKELVVSSDRHIKLP